MRFVRVNVIAAMTMAAVLSLASSAPAQTEVPSLGEVFTGTLANFRNLPTAENIALLTMGGLGAAATYPVDSNTSRTLAGSDALHEPLEAGAVIGGTPFALGASLATYGLGRALDKPRMARLGADLIQAQLMAETLAFAIKHVARRERPDGTSYSFPSGHATVSFASADILRRSFGWKVGLPAYAVASYVATSRIQSRRHYLSDVVFGAALGTVAGRTVTISRSHQVAISPMVSVDRAQVMFSVHRRGARS